MNFTIDDLSCKEKEYNSGRVL